MAAMTTTRDGTWSNTTAGVTPWTALTGSGAGGVPGDGDTVTLSHSVTISANVTVGSDPGTGGTAAILWDNVTGKTLTVNDGVNLTLKGDFTWANSSTSNVNDFVVGAGCTISLLPGSGQTYKYIFPNAKNGRIILNGTSGSRTTFKTDKSSGGNAGYFTVSGYTVQGITTATYVDFIDFGDTTNWGIRANRARGGVNLSDALTHLTITDSTFTRCNFFLGAGTGSWDGNVTIQRVTFASSVVISTFGGSLPNACATIALTDSGTAGTRTFDTIGFDKQVYFNSYKARSGGGAVSNCVFGDLCGFNAASTWATEANFTANVLYSVLNISIYGPSGGNYWACTTAANPHFVLPQATVSTFTADLFEGANASNDGVGDIIMPATAKTSVTVSNCIVLPSSNGKTAGKLVSNLQAATTAVTTNHNTQCATSGEHGLVGLDETASSYAGEVASCLSNLIWDATAGTNVFAIKSSGAGTPAVDAVTVAGYNGFWNPASGTCYYNTSTSQASVVGYSGIKISPNTTYPNATVGNNDVTVTSDPFVDKTRNLAKWGQVIHATDGSYSAAIALLLATPSLASAASTGLFAWVRAGWNVTGAAGLLLKDLGHDSVTIGAMEYVAQGQTSAKRAAMSKFMRPTEVGRAGTMVI